MAILTPLLERRMSEQMDEDELQYSVKWTVNPARVRRVRGYRELREREQGLRQMVASSASMTFPRLRVSLVKLLNHA